MGVNPSVKDMENIDTYSPGQGFPYYEYGQNYCKICNRSVDKAENALCGICEIRELIKLASAGMAVAGLESESEDLAKLGLVINVACWLSHLIY